MEAYLNLVEKVLTEGKVKKDRTNVGTIAIPGAMIEHNMLDGFPLLTTKQVSHKLIFSEMEFFIKGITDKEWLRERNNHIWDEWCSPEKVKYSHDPEIQKQMNKERELGPIYGWQWRNFGANYVSYDKPPQGQGIDQLKNVIDKLKTDPNDRRMIVSAWNPTDLHKMALPPCHYCFQINVIDGHLNLMYNIRSQDLMLGAPYNIAEYALMLHLLAKESNFKEGKLVGFLGDVHIYLNHIEGAKEQLKRRPRNLPKIVTNNFTDIFSWTYTDTTVIDYNPHPRIKFEVAI